MLVLPLGALCFSSECHFLDGRHLHRPSVREAYFEAATRKSGGIEVEQRLQWS
jgi:hypothetical protein